MKFLTKNNIILTIVILILAFAYIRDFFTDKTIEPVKTIETVATTTEFTTKESTDFFDIDVKYPDESLDTNRVMEKYVKDTVNTYKEDWKTGGEVYNFEKEMSVKYPDRPMVKYLLNITYSKFESKTLGTVSYVFEEYTFTGGAHGNNSITTYTFDKNGKLSIDHFIDFKENNNIIITKMLESKLKVFLGDYYDSDVLRDGLGLNLLKPDGITVDIKKNIYQFSYESNFNKFIILDEGIKFIFGQYQVAPYVVGSPEVILTWDELKPYLINKNN